MRYSLPKALTRKAVLAAGSVAVLAGGAAVGLASTADAAITATSPLYSTTNGESGYGTQAASGHAFKNVQAVITPDQYGTTVKGGAIGIQLTTAPATSGANAGKCYAVQFGLVANTSTSTYAADYGLGNVASTTGVNDCATSGVVSTTSALSSTTDSLPNSDSYWMSLTYVNKPELVCVIAPHGSHGKWGHFVWCYKYNKAGIWLQEENLTTATSTTTPTVKWVTDPHNFVHASAGISLDNSTALSPAALINEPGTSTVSPLTYVSAADQEVAEFDYATVTYQGSNTPQNFDATNLKPDMAVDGPLTGTLVDTHDSLQDTSPFIGGGITTLETAALGSIHGASSTGNAFEVFTANSIG